MDSATPELSLWVRPDERGHGMGRSLLRLLKEGARSRGIPGLSLSVEAGNHARLLYVSEGFADVPGREEAGVMVWRPAD